MLKQELEESAMYKNIPLIMAMYLLSNPLTYGADVCNRYPSCVFLPKQEESTEQIKLWQNNSLPLPLPLPFNKSPDSDVSVQIGWKLKQKLEQSNEWRTEVDVKF
jgi:hypothetical protein